MTISKVTLLILGTITVALGLMGALYLIPEYREDMNLNTCRIYAMGRGLIFRDKGNIIPNEWETAAYDSISKSLPLPTQLGVCKPRNKLVNASEFSTSAEFKKEFIYTVGWEVYQCYSVYKYGSNNPFYPGGSGVNPAVCSVIRYDSSGYPITIEELIDGIRNVPISSLRSGSEKIKDKVDFMFENQFLDVDCLGCYTNIEGYFGYVEYNDFHPENPGCSEPACAFGAYAISGRDIEHSLSGNVREQGVIYVTFLDFPGKMIRKMSMGNNACGFFGVNAAKGTEVLWKPGELLFVNWEQADTEYEDIIMICYEPLNIPTS